MTDMVEKVAKALALAALDPETRAIVDLEAHFAHVERHYTELARAAIEALREPSEDICDAGADAHGVWGFGASDAAVVFKAMIDSALSQPKTGD